MEYIGALLVILLVAHGFAIHQLIKLKSEQLKLTKLADLDQKIKDRLKTLSNPSVQLEEFLSDLTHEGCGIVRIDPGAILIRGLRR